MMTTATAQADGIVAADLNPKFERQDDLYAFPYHHLPHRDPRGGLSISRTLGWGAEYLCYLEHVASLVRRFAPTTLLDAGCGDGRLFTLLSGNEIPHRTGADLSERAIAYARAFTPSARWHVGSIDELNEVFDVVTAIEVMEHVPNEVIPSFVHSLVDRVQVGGHAIVTVPSVVLPLNAKHYRHYDESLLRAQLQTDERWEILEVQHVIRDDAYPLQVMRLLTNRWWSIDLPALRGWLWRSFWNDARIAPAGQGRHLVAILRRTR